MADTPGPTAQGDNPDTHAPENTSGWLQLISESLKQKEVQKAIAILLYQLAVLGGAFAMHHEFGMEETTIFVMSALSAQLLVMFALRTPVPVIFYVEFVLLGAFLIPGLFMSTEHHQLQEFVTGMALGLAFLAGTVFSSKHLIKSLIPKVMIDAAGQIPFQPFKALHKSLVNGSPDVWKRIDYLWAAELLLSAVISYGVALLGTEDQWHMAKTDIAPVLITVATGTGLFMLYQDTKGAKTPTPNYERLPHHA